MKQLPNETYEELKLRRQVENEQIDSKLSWRMRWNSTDKGTFVKTRPPATERPKRTPKVKVRKRKRISGLTKRRVKGATNVRPGI